MVSNLPRTSILSLQPRSRRVDVHIARVKQQDVVLAWADLLYVTTSGPMPVVSCAGKALTLDPMWSSETFIGLLPSQPPTANSQQP